MRDRLPWMGLYLLSLSWLMALPLYGRVDSRWPWLVFAAGLFIAVSRFPVPFRGLRPAPMIILAVLLAVAAAILPSPYRWPPLLTAASLAAELLRRRVSWLSFLGRGLGITGVLWGLEALILPPVFFLLANYHHVPGLGRLFHLLLLPLWPGAAYTEGTVFLPAPEALYEFTPSLEQLGFLPWIMLTGSGLALLWSRRAGARHMVPFLALGFGYLIWRYVLMALVLTAFKDPHVWWETFPLALSFFPWALFCFLVFPLPSPLRGREETDRAAARWRPSAAAACLALLGLAGALAFHDPGARKEGRILIDELHSNWEWTTQEFDTEWYGKKSGYNYYNLADWLGYYFEVDIRSEEITPELLADYDMLFIKTPTEAFSPEETEAVRSFVEEGGGLFVDGDHTNVFGTSTYLNELVRPFGFRFRYDSTYDLLTGDLNLYHRPRVSPHPVVRHLPPYLFATSCTLEMPFWHQAVMVGNNLKAVYLDYARTSFFPEKEGRTNFLFGLLLQAAAVTYGKGRVLAYTDSTCLSNFFMFIPGKPELALGCFDWLNRRNRLGWMNGFLLLIGLIALGLTVFLAGRAGIHSLPAVVGGAVAGLVTVLVLCEAIDRHTYAAPDPVRAPTRIAFEREYSLYSLPELHLTRTRENSYHTFFVWVQRLGFVPRAYPTLDEALEKGRVVVMINPAKPISVEDMDKIHRFVLDGGDFVVMRDPTWRGRGADQVAGSVGMSFERGVADSTMLRDLEGADILVAHRAGAITGGTPLLLRQDGRAAMAAVERGGGRIVALAAPSIFTDETMGATGSIPTPERRRLYEVEFWLFRDFLIGRAPMPVPPGRERRPASTDTPENGSSAMSK